MLVDPKNAYMAWLCAPHTNRWPASQGSPSLCPNKLPNKRTERGVPHDGDAASGYGPSNAIGTTFTPSGRR